MLRAAALPAAMPAPGVEAPLLSHFGLDNKHQSCCRHRLLHHSFLSQKGNNPLTPLCLTAVAGVKHKGTTAKATKALLTNGAVAPL